MIFKKTDANNGLMNGNYQYQIQKNVIIPIINLKNTPSRKFKLFTKHTKSQIFYEACFKSFIAVTSAFAMTIDKAKKQTLTDGVILVLDYRNGIYRLINYEKLFVVLTRIKEISHLRFLVDTYNDLSYFTKLKPKEYIGTFIDIMKQKQ